MKSDSQQDVFEENVERMLTSVTSESDSASEENLVKAVLAEVRKQRSGLGSRSFLRKYYPTTAAAAIVFAILVSLVLWDKSVPSAYAFEQTMEASQDLRYVHYIFSYWEHGEQLFEQEVWQKLDENGDILEARIEEKGGQRIVVVSADMRHKEWIPAKNQFTMRICLGIERGHFRRKWSDPASATRLLHRLHAEREVTLSVERTKLKDKSLRLIATHTDKHVRRIKEQEASMGLQRSADAIRRRFVLLIDPKTKLMRQSEIYRPSNGEWTLQERTIYLECDQPIDPSLFDLQAPTEAQIIDMTEGIGLAQGTMTDAEAAAETVRQYFEAMIRADYARAAKLYHGMEPNKLRQQIEERLKIKYLRIVEIDEPEPVREPYYRGCPAFLVPYEIEIETANGERRIVGPPGGHVLEHKKAAVVLIPGKTGLWVIMAGI